MSYKKQVVTIMTLLVLLLLTMSTTIQAASIGKVYNLSATMNESQIKLTWSSVSGAAGYNVYVNDIRIGSVSSNEASLIGFSNNTTYRFKIAAYDTQKREGTSSSEIRFTTTAQATLAQVKNLTVTQVNGYVTLNWSAVSNANKYQVFVNVPNFGELNIGEVTTTNAMLKGFKEGQKYGFAIRACQTLSSGNLNYGQKSSMQYCTIDYDKDDSNYNTDDDFNTNIGTVQNVKVSNITDTKVTVSWGRNTNADGYEVLLSKNYGTYKTVADKSGTTAYLYNLDPDTFYRVKVVPYEKVNGTKKYGEASSYKSFTTGEANGYIGTVTHLNATVKNRNEAYLTWWPVDKATGYEVYISKEGSNYERITWTTENTTILTSDMLDYSTNYKVKVRAYKNVSYTNKDGYYSVRGEFSNVESFKTEKYNRTQDSPNVAKVTGVKAPVKGTSVYLSWNKVSGAAGYEIDFTVPGIGSVKLYANTNYREVSGVTGKDYDYTARIRAYKYVNGVKEYGVYSDLVKFREN